MKLGNRGPVAVLVAILASAGAWAGETAVRLESGVDILQEWREDQHVYVKGKIGVAPAQLGELEKWMDAKARNWTVLLVQSAAGESYRDANGRTYRSVDAIEHAMGKGLPAKTKFGSLVHPDTGQASGAFFILFLQERNFSYYGSAVYERRGLGANKWAGNLDASAKRAMRNGGRIVEAAKGTIIDIDRRLATALQQEKRRKEEARMRAEREKEEARLRAERRKVAVAQAITSGEQEYAALEGLLTAFRQDAQRAEGDLARTDSASWQADLASAHQALAAGQVEMAETVTKVTREEMANLATILRQYEGDAARVQQAVFQVAGAKAHPLNKLGPSAVKSLRARVGAVRNDYAAGNRGYRNSLEEVERGLKDLQRENAWAAETQRHRAQRAADQRRMRINTVRGVAGGAGALLVLGGVVGNRRRRKIKAEAEALLAERRNELKDVSDRLIALMDRASLVVGSEADLSRRGYAGETLAEAKRGIAAVDEAFVISSHVHDLIAQGALLVEPGNLFSAARNLVGRGRYERAVELLDAEVVCRPASPPPLPGRTAEQMPERPGIADGEEFALELPEWTARLERTMAQGAEAIDAVDVAWSTIVDRREGLQRAIAAVKSGEDRIEPLAEDGWLGLIGLFASWVPAMEKKLEEAMETSRADPVAALRGPVADGDRMSGEALELIERVLAFRESRWGEIRKHEERLHRHKRATVWLDQRLDALTQQAEEIALAGEAASVADRVASFGECLHTLADRVGHAAREAERADKKALPALDAATREVARVRDGLGRSLGVAAETVLVESPERDPSRLLAEGRNQREAAQAALDVGEPQRAEEFLDEVDRLVEESRTVVHSTQEAFKLYDSERRGLIAAREAWERRVTRIKELVTKLRAEYAPQALLVDVDAGEGVSYADAPQRFDEGLRSVAGLLDGAAAGYATARLLEAREMLREGSQRVSAGEDLCSEIEVRRDALASMEAENTARLNDRIRACEDLAGPLSDRRVMRATVTLFAEASARLGEARVAVESEGDLNDPYRAASLLEDLDARLTVIRGEVKNDLRLHQHAVEVLEKVRVSEREAGGLASRAQGDSIPDSRRTSEGLDEVRRGSQALAGLAEAMQEDHGDWRAVVDELGAIHATLSAASVNLREELRLAQEAVAGIRQAEAAVRRASLWSGSYGVRIAGSPGGNSIVEANRAIMAGDYHSCMRHAGFAITRARQAIAQAEAEEAAIRRAREEEERARRAAARRSRMSSASNFGSSRSSSSSFGSSSFGSSSFGSSSSVGRSSFSSGSGVGRSGW